MHANRQVGQPRSWTDWPKLQSNTDRRIGGACPKASIIRCAAILARLD
jgi:hypothetical protein